MHTSTRPERRKKGRKSKTGDKGQRKSQPFLQEIIATQKVKGNNKLRSLIAGSAHPKFKSEVSEGKSYPQKSHMGEERQDRLVLKERG